MGKTKHRKKAPLILTIINFIIFCALVVSSIFFVYTMVNTGIVPNKYLYITGGVLGLITIVDFIFILKKFRIISIIYDILLVLIIVVEILAIPKMNTFIEFIKYNFNSDYDVSVYNIMVSTSSSYNSLEDLKGKAIIILDEILKI